MRDAGEKGSRGVFVRGEALAAGTAVISAEAPLAFASPASAGGAGDEEQLPLRLLTDALNSREALVGLLCAAEVPEETRRAARQVAEVAVKMRRSSAIAAPSQSDGPAEVEAAQDLLLRLFCNTHSLEDGGMGIYALASALNHDCDPNCTFFASASPDAGAAGKTLKEVALEMLRWRKRPRLTVRTLKEIPPGGELTLGYVPLRWPKWKRAALLQRNYGFLCACRRCADDDEDRGEAEAGEKALLAIAAKMRKAVAEGGAGLEPSPLTKLLAQVKALAHFQDVLAAQVGSAAAEAFASAGSFRKAALAYHDVLARARASPCASAGPHAASVALSLAAVLLRLAAAPDSSSEEARVALGRAMSEAKAALAVLRTCRGEDHEATARAATLLSQATTLNIERKDAKLLGILMERKANRVAEAAATAGGDATAGARQGSGEAASEA